MAWPEEAREEFERGFPPPYDGEPADLRRDIADELADHLACALERERARTGDETQARRAALERFGNPRSLARQLWFEAMKEKLMKDRIMFVSVVLLALAAVAGAIFSWQAFQQSQRANQAMLAALDKIAGGQGAMSKDKGSLRVIVAKPGKDKAPVKGVNVELTGKIFDPTKDESIALTTDDQGIVTFGPMNPGRVNIRISGPVIDQVPLVCNDTTVVFAGQEAAMTVAYPETPMAPVTLALDPESPLKNMKVLVYAQLAANIQSGASHWSRQCEVLMKPETGAMWIRRQPAEPLSKISEDQFAAGQQNQPVNWPAAQYKLTDLGVFTPNTDDFSEYIFTNRIDLPAGQGPTYAVAPNQPSVIKITIPETQARQIQMQAVLRNSEGSARETDPQLCDLVKGKLVQIQSVSADSMILAYLPDWAHGEVDNIGVANNEGGVRTLLRWLDIQPDSEAFKAGRKYYLALYSRESKDLSAGGKKIEPAPAAPTEPAEPAAPAAPTTTTQPVNTALATTDSTRTIFAHIILADWRESGTSWKTQPAVSPQPAAQDEYQPGAGWKLFDVTPIVRAWSEGKMENHGIMLRFAREDATSTDWIGYQMVSREAEGEWAAKRPVLLTVDEE